MSTIVPQKGALAVAGEFVVIVVGVFVAVAAESWWSGREGRLYERELRQDMTAEFEANLRVLERDLGTSGAAHDRITYLAELDEETLLSLSPEALTDASTALTGAGFDPEMGSAQALVESGGIGAIGDRELRLLLSKWAGLLEEKRRYNLQSVGFYYDHVVRVVAAASADQEWTESERRELRVLLQTYGSLQGYVLNNQGRLKGAAQEILDHVRQ